MRKILGLLTALFFLISSNAQDYHPNGVVVGTDEAGANITQKAEFNWGDVFRVYRAGTNVWNLQSRLDLANCPNFTSANLYINDQVALHANNFNSYAPTLTGTGASGNWNINASRWGGRTADFSSFVTGNIAWLTGALDDGSIRPWGASDVKTFLGLLPGGETLQSVVNKDGIVVGDNVLPVIYNRGSSGSYMGTGYMTNGGLKWTSGFREGTDNFHLYNATLGNSQLVLVTSGESYFNGNVGVGTTSPSEKLSVLGNGAFGTPGVSSNSKISVFDNDIITKLQSQNLGDNKGIVGTESNHGFKIITNNSDRMTITAEGNVGIGTVNPQSELAVKGTITSKKVKVTQEGWADYVFDSSYQLTPLHQVEKFIQANKHLPDVPSAAEVKKEGLDVGDNQAVLLKKIEELTLYIIQQSKEIDALKKRVGQVESDRR